MLRKQASEAAAQRRQRDSQDRCTQAENMKIISSLILLFFTQLSFSQTTELTFLNYDEIIDNLIKEGENSKYLPNLDFDAIMYLDINSYELLKSLDDDFEKFDDWILIKEFDVDIKNIKDLFLNEALFKKITFELTKEGSYNIKQIYLKSPNKAVYEISAKKGQQYYWGKTIGVFLENNKLKGHRIFEFVE